MEEQGQNISAISAAAAEEGAPSVKEEKEEFDEHDYRDEAEEEDEETLPHSEILDIFEEGLAQIVQDPLLCDLPIQVNRLYKHSKSYSNWDMLTHRFIFSGLY